MPLTSPCNIILFPQSTEYRKDKEKGERKYQKSKDGKNVREEYILI